jgi:hypothetical protein
MRPSTYLCLSSMAGNGRAMTADCLLRAFLNGGQERAVTSPQAPAECRVLLAVKGDKLSPTGFDRGRCSTNEISALQAS